MIALCFYTFAMRSLDVCTFSDDDNNNGNNCSRRLFLSLSDDEDDTSGRALCTSSLVLCGRNLLVCTNVVPCPSPRLCSFRNTHSNTERTMAGVLQPYKTHSVVFTHLYLTVFCVEWNIATKSTYSTYMKLPVANIMHSCSMREYYCTPRNIHAHA